MSLPVRLATPTQRATLVATMNKPKILTAKELRAIMPRLAGWTLAQNKLTRTFEFQDFVHSLSFVNSLVAYFETVDHHPDVRIAYGEVTFRVFPIQPNENKPVEISFSEWLARRGNVV